MRELENTIERAALMHDGELLLPQHINFLFPSVAPTFTASPSPVGNDTLAPGLETLPDPCPLPFSLDLRNLDTLILPEGSLSLEALTDAVVRAALKRFDGNKTRAAEYLGISRFALHRRLQ